MDHADEVSEEIADRCFKEGDAARAANKSLNSCPYSGERSYAAQMWRSGWQHRQTLEALNNPPRGSTGHA